MRVIIREYLTMRPRGDRDTQRHPCYAFEVVLENSNKGSTVVFSNDQHNSWWTTIDGTRDEYLREAQAKALEIADIVGCPVDISPNNTEVDTLRIRIAEDTARLQELES